MRHKLLFLAILALLLSGGASQGLKYTYAGGNEAHGGDHIRGSFIRFGTAVLYFLKNNTVGIEIVRNYSLDLERLEKTLDVKNIKVFESIPSIDGSIVDAIGAPNEIKLSKSDWRELILSGSDIHYLVFHEMLWAAGYDDHNYAISKAINPFPPLIDSPRSNVDYHKFEIATVLGQPNPSLDFIQSLVKESINLLGNLDKPEHETSTSIYSLLARKGVTAAVSIEALSEKGYLTSAVLKNALEVAASRAPIALTNVGPIQNKVCEHMSRYPNTVFIVASGNSGRELDPNENPACLSGNILYVAALDQKKRMLADFANWGQQVRLAAPSIDIRAIGKRGKQKTYSNMSMGLSIVGGRLAIFARNHTDLKGSELIDQFLEETAYELPDLKGKIPGGLAIDDNGK